MIRVLWTIHDVPLQPFIFMMRRIFIKLKGNDCYILEFGYDGLCDTMFFNDKFITENEKMKAALVRYNQKTFNRLNIKCFVYIAVVTIEGNGYIEDS